ncbi:MAG TPA: DUF1009 domain-containing protein [Candidatus Omnitrophica bacterium]|nr:DUF1009 domain-containing protein [Candidatus Omnitrophota bacterium]
MSDSCAIIAGAGSFPIQVAQEARRQGLRVAVIGLKGWADPALAQHADSYEELSVGQLTALIERLKTHHIRQAIMAGKVTKGVLFDSRVQLDGETLGLLGRLKDFSVNSLLGAIAQRLAREGITLLDSSTFLGEALCPEGALTRSRPSDEEQEDIRVGVEVARQIASLDIGQTVVVKRKVVVALEAMEGTDAVIQRAGQVAGRGCVVVKMASPKQDRRFDLPVLGPQTIAVAAAAGVRCAAVEARSTVLLDKAVLIEQADRVGLALVGVVPPHDSHP